MDDEFDSVKKQNNLAELLGKEDLDPYSVEELKSRKILLEQEIKRIDTKISFAKDHMSAAEKLFK